jgi:hypothetical protein
MGKESTTKIVGAVFPIISEHASNLFDNHRNIFVKFTKMDLADNSIIIFYVSRQKLFVGEARILHSRILNPNVVWASYGEKIYLDKEDYNEYVKFSPVTREVRKMNKITVFELDDIKRYKEPSIPTIPVTSSGRFLTKELLKQIRSGNLKEEGAS